MKTQFVTLVLGWLGGSLLLIGCESINQPQRTNFTENADKPVWMKAAEAQGLQLIILPEKETRSLAKQVSTTKLCLPEANNKLQVNYNYVTSTGRNVWVVSSLTVVQGALDTARYLTMTIDDEALTTRVRLTFGPPGVKFLKPALLNFDAKGLDLSGYPKGSVFKLYHYHEDKEIWEEMVTEKISVNLRSGQLTCVNGELPHFSRYAFAR